MYPTSMLIRKFFFCAFWHCFGVFLRDYLRYSVISNAEIHATSGVCIPVSFCLFTLRCQPALLFRLYIVGLNKYHYESKSGNQRKSFCLFSFHHPKTVPNSAMLISKLAHILSLIAWLQHGITAHSESDIKKELFMKESFVQSIKNMSHFQTALAERPHSFVKFFHPQCTHCIAMAPAFVNLSRLVHDYNQRPNTFENRTIQCLEVDVTLEANRPLTKKYSHGTPTLILFSGNTSMEEYENIRQAQPMFKFIVSSIELSESAGLPHFTKTKPLTVFMNLVDTRPIVISVIHTDLRLHHFFPRGLQLPTLTEWRAISATSMLDPKPIFATVSDPTLLVPSCSADRYQNLSTPHALMPVAVLARSASNLCADAHWYFPGVKDSQSLSTFIHSSLAHSRQFNTAKKETAVHLLNADRPLLLVFGNSTELGYFGEYKFRAALAMVSNPPVLPIYLQRSAFPDFAEYIGLPSVSPDNKNNEDLSLLMYRYSNTGPIVTPYVGNISGSNSMKAWVKKQSRLINDSKVVTSAGDVLILTRETWPSLFNFDNRAVVLLLAEGVSSSDKSWMASIAAALRNEAGHVVVALYADGLLDRPSWPDTSEVVDLPALMMITPAGGMVAYDGWWTTRSVARFARNMAEVETALGNGITWGDVAVCMTLVTGILLVASGLYLFLKRKRHGFAGEDENKTLTKIQ